MKRVLRIVSRLALAIAFAGVVSCGNNTLNQQKEKTIPRQGSSSAGHSQPADTIANKGQQDKTVKEPWLLIPGKSAGLTQLNENAEKVYQRFGEPDGGDAAMQKAVAIWYTRHDSTQHSTAIYTAREPGVDPVARVRQIRITSPSFQTAEGIHTGSTVREIQAAYSVQQTEKYIDNGISYRVFDSRKGIAFEIKPDGSCIAIVIHKTGIVNESTYLKFRTTNKFIAGKKTSL